VSTIRIVAVAGLSLALLLSSQTAYSATKKQASSSKKQASPSKGDLSDQQIQVSIPYCDAYFPYKIEHGSGPTQVKQLLSKTPTEPELETFLANGYSTSDPINPPDSDFEDPGYPLLGDPSRHLYADASDFIRLYTRLLASEPSGAGPQGMCLQSTSKANDVPPNDKTVVYYLVNIVRWKISGGMYQISSSDWYVFNKSDGQAAHRQFPFTFHPYVSGDLRIFGSHKVFFLAVHLAPGPSLSWTASTKVKKGQWLSPTQPNGHYYIANNDGTTGDSDHEPAWCTASGCSIADNGIMWIEAPQPTNNRSNAPFTWTPTTQVTIGQVAVPTTANGRYYIAQNDGTTGPTGHEPTWCTASACTVSDNKINWKESVQVPDTFAPTWAAATPVTSGEVVVPTSPNGHFYIAQNAGSTSGSGHEPGWCLGSGCTLSDNGVTWKESARPPDNYASIWTPTTQVIAGEFFLPTSPNGRYYIAQNDGTTSGNGHEPTWCTSTTSDCTVVDNNITWKESPHPPDNYPDFKKNVEVSYKMHVDRVEPANIQDLKALIGVIAGQPAAAAFAQHTSPAEASSFKAFFFAANDRDYTGLYGAAKLVNLKNLPVQITATATAQLKKTTQQDADAYSYLGMWDEAKPGTQAQPAPKTSSNSGTASGGGSASASANKGSSSGTPSGTSAKSSSTGGPTVGTTSGPGCTTKTDGGSCTETLKVQNEGLHWWDVSVGIPFKTINQLSYASSSSGQVTPTTESKKTAYGFVALAPWNEDFLSPPSLGIPHILVGVPLSGKVFDFPFVGAGETFNLSKVPGIGSKLAKVVPFSIRFYSGLVENKTFGTASDGGTPPHRWIGKLQYGIEFSVRDVANKLTGKSSSSTASQTSKTGSSKTD
jgi:hypothetical protein